VGRAVAVLVLIGSANYTITQFPNYRILMGGFNLQELMSKAKSQYETLQKKMQETVVEATSGGGTVTAKMDGRKQLLSLRIDPEAVKTGDVEMLQDLVLAAVNEAGRKIDAQMQSTVGGMLGGLGMGGM
jgi:DNA-binding YbaB/EbfC family protein